MVEKFDLPGSKVHVLSNNGFFVAISPSLVVDAIGRAIATHRDHTKNDLLPEVKIRSSSCDLLTFDADLCQVILIRVGIDRENAAVIAPDG
jgi:hypothetical protein